MVLELVADFQSLSSSSPYLSLMLSKLLPDDIACTVAVFADGTEVLSCLDLTARE